MSIRPRYWIGQTVRLRVSFTDEAGDALAVTGAALVVQPPNGSAQSVSISANGVGVFTADVAGTVAGEWRWRATCAGPQTAASEGSFVVVPSALGV